MENIKKNFGFIEPIIKPEDYKFGSGQIDVPILRLDGQYDDSVPADESQVPYGLDPYNCTGFGLDNQAEITLKTQFGGDYNYSDRFTGIVAGTRPPGNDPNIVYEAGRKNGFIPESILPFTNDLKTIDDYYSFKNANEVECRKQGLDWLKNYSIKHDWVHSDKTPADPEMIKAALKYSPLGVAVYAWANDGTYYIRAGEDTHWVVMYGFEDGRYWKIFDSYNNSHKQLTWNFGFYFIKRISIEKQATPEQISIVQQILVKMTEILKKMSEWLFNNAQKAIELPSIPIIPPNPISEPPKPESPVEPPVAPKYSWLTPTEARHSVRVICDEEGLTLQQKNEVCQTIACESGFNPKAVGKKNSDGSTDYGIAQFNSRYWIGFGSPFPTPEYVLNNPEACVRKMATLWKKNKKHYWVCWKNNKYKLYDA